jgi:hypothetical protein
LRRRWGRKDFFFEKKKQKTFGFLGAWSELRRLSNKSFLVLFFKKELLAHSVAGAA